MISRLFDRPWKRLGWLVLIPALTYLPSAFQLTYYRDDWYYAYDALVGPGGVFQYMFAGDRPARGPFFALYHALFGISPLPYHLAMFAWRVAGGLATLWLFSLLWPSGSKAGWVAGLLFELYPGFTWWVSGIEYQPMVASATLMVVSLGLTVAALRMHRSRLQLACALGSILTGWIYLSLVEYAAGMEVFRLGLIYLVLDSRGARTFVRRLSLALRRGWVYLIIPGGFAIWRFLLFNSERKATDLGAQISGLLSDPLSTGLHWIANFLLSIINVIFAAWVVPLTGTFFSGALRDIVPGLLLALFAGALGWLFLFSWTGNSPRTGDPQPANWVLEAMGVGAAGVALGIAPVIIANRHIAFPSFSHYALPASLGLAFLISGFMSVLTDPGIRTWMVSILVVLASMTHQGLGANALHEERVIARFWHQMAWRAPSIAPNTTVLAYYPGLDYGEDTDIVWGPANSIYHPQQQDHLPVQVPISALTADKSTLNRILVGSDARVSPYRAHTLTVAYDDILVLNQTTEDSCVRVLDPHWSMFSVSDDPELRLLNPYASVESIQTAAAEAVPPARLFGSEPEHGWCFYFEKAALAGQYGRWQEIAAIQDTIDELGLHPNDQIEWMPFLQARAFLGDLQKVKEISTRINTEKLYKQQACENLSNMAAQGYRLSSGTQDYVNQLFCGGMP